MAPPLAALGGCVVALLLLAGTPAAQAAPCAPGGSGVPTPGASGVPTPGTFGVSTPGASGVPTSGCNAGATGAKVAGSTGSVAKPTLPSAPAAPTAPCVPAGAGMAGCGSGAIRSMVPGLPGPLQNLLPGARDMRAESCGPGIRGNAAPGCNRGAAGGAGAVVQGVMTFMQVVSPTALLPH
jgi:hypothetical protein